jgi:hypothetical protein
MSADDQRAVAASCELLDAVREVLAEGARRGLHQHPAPAAERHPGQLVGAQALERRLSHLPALKDRDRDPLEAQPSVERLDALGDLVYANVVVMADVRGGADRLDAVHGSLPRHPNAVPQVERAIVDAGEDVAVQIDQGANRHSGDAVQKHGATMTGMIQHLLPLGLREPMGFNRE